MGILHRSTRDTDDVDVVKGPSLARMPTHLIGTALLTFGLLALIKHNDFPSFEDNFTDGTATGGTFLGIGVNGWTAWLCIAAGGLLLLGAAQHLAARTMALIVGLVLGAASVIALRDGDDVLGLAYANGPTKLALGIAAAALLLTALLPRTRKTVHHDHDHDHDAVPHREHPVVEEPVQRTGRFERDREPVVDRAEERALAGGAAERAHEAREQHAEPRTEVVRPATTTDHDTAAPTAGTTDHSPIARTSASSASTTRPDSLGSTGTGRTAPPADASYGTAPRRSGGIVGRLRRRTDDR